MYCKYEWKTFLLISLKFEEKMSVKKNYRFSYLFFFAFLSFVAVATNFIKIYCLAVNVQCVSIFFKVKTDN
jgi:hypothetical protein